MMTIHKYALPSWGTVTYSLPEESRILSVGLDPAGALSVWVQVPLEDASVEGREFIVRWTGDTFAPSAQETFLGTVVNTASALVYHVWTR